MSSHRSPKTKMPAYDAAKHRAFKDKARGIESDSESECWSVWVQWPPAGSPGLAAGNARLCGKLRQQRQRSQRTACA